MILIFAVEKRRGQQKFGYSLTRYAEQTIFGQRPPPLSADDHAKKSATQGSQRKG